MREIPNIKKTHKELSGDKFTVLGVAVWTATTAPVSRRWPKWK